MDLIDRIGRNFEVGETSTTTRGWRRLLAIGALCIGLAACGGGGGGGDSGGGGTPPPATGTLRVTVSDTLGARVADATVRATVGTANVTASTDAQGIAQLAGVVAGTASVTVSKTGFLSKTVTAAITANQTTDLAVTLDRPGSLRVTVSDTFGALVSGATVQATVGTASTTATTDAQGIALLAGLATGSASVTVSRSTFLPKTVAATIIENQTTDLAVVLDRATTAAGGSLTSRGAAPVASANFQTVTFEIELVVVDSNSQPIQSLTAADFALRACTPITTNAPLIDCVRGSAADFDVAYTPATSAPESLSLVPGETAQPYAAALMLDQSRSISASDPTGARLFSSKAFLNGLGGGDRALLSAFANDSTTTALIPEKPLTIYPPFRDSGTVSSDPSYFATLDSLTALVGGGTPLYASLDLLRERVVTDPSLPVGIKKAVIIFTDGGDTDCGGPNTCRTVRTTSIQEANADQLRVFTIGLSNGVNFEALGELANKTGGVFLFAESADQLIPLYGSVGRLLSLSLPTYRLRWTVQAANANVFLPGNAVLGRVAVTAGSQTFDVPFIVGIP